MPTRPRPARLAPAAAIAALLATLPVRAAQIEEIVITAQKRAESAQDVPIAISAYSQDDLVSSQVTGFADLRRSAPAVTFSKGNFTSYNLKIRGIGTDLVAATSDHGVGVHVNEVPLNSPYLYETEFFDIQQLFVLRGPQGTLYGRNSTGGAVNMATRTAVPGEFDANLEGQAGNYGHARVNGMVNIPLADSLALRLAGLWLQRDGFTRNLYTGHDIDDRDQQSLRASLRWTPGDATTIDVMASWFNEHDRRMRSQKMLCHQDPSAILGCLPDRLAYERPHGSTVLSNLLVSDLVLGPLGIYPFMSTPPVANPRDLRAINADRDPAFDAEETLLTLHLAHDFDWHTLDLVAGYQDAPQASTMDYLADVGPQVTLPAQLAVIAPRVWAARFADGLLPMSATSANGTGAVGGHIDSRLPRLEAYDSSGQLTDQRSLEVRLASRYEGALNWMAGLFHLDVDTSTEYAVYANGLDYFSLVMPVAGLGLGAAGDGLGWVAPNFNNRTDFYGITSNAAFGEVYAELTDTVKLTLGARYTVDRKKIVDRQLLFNVDANGLPLLQPLDADLPIPIAQRRIGDEWREWTGRAVLDWSPTDAVLLYASWSRGYKGGGFNPPLIASEFPDQRARYDPEFIDAWEIGAKNTLLDGTLQANVAAYYYDYVGMQVSKIVNRTSFNENIDARLYGFEAQLLFVPDDHWRLSANLAHQHTEIRELWSVDPRDPSGGRDDVTVLKDLRNGANCVAQVPGATFDALGQQYGFSRFTDCSALRASPLNAALDITGGIPVNLEGNRLLNTPAWQLDIGVEHTFSLPLDYRLALRLDYAWQAHMWGRNFNRDPIDRIGAWDIWNAQASLTAPAARWYARLYVRNIADADNITGMFLTDPNSGLFTNVFTIDPRTWGLAVGYNF